MTDSNPAALKEIFNSERLAHIAEEMTAVYPPFDRARFLALTHKGLADLSLMQRLARVSESLYQVLPLDYKESLKVLKKLAPRLNSGFVSICLPHYVASYGADSFKTSMDALQFFTRFGSSEFAVRHFLLSDFEPAMALMQRWSLDDNEHVRRLASEGSRPRLPWSFRLAQIQADPTLAAPILDNLKADPSLYVRKSVANHLNDITKDHPEWVLDLLESWPGDNPHTTWIIRHGLRSLIKQGNNRALALIGAGAKAEVEIHNLRIEPAIIRLGDAITISFDVLSTGGAEQRLVVDYAIDYVKQSGASAGKVFKLKGLSLGAGAQVSLKRRQHVRDMTTRKHYPGVHAVHVQVNGERMASTSFEIIN